MVEEPVPANKQKVRYKFIRVRNSKIAIIYDFNIYFNERRIQQ